MANFVYITLDTTAPTNPTISIEGAAVHTSLQMVTVSIGVSDAVTTGYQMKIWGDVDNSNDPNVQTTEVASQWASFSNSPQVKLSAGDGTKTLSVKVRDDVHNPSTVAIDSITMDTSIPTVTVTNPSVAKISKVEGKDATSFTFTVSEDYIEYKVKLVGSTGATEGTGTQIGTAGGSTNVAGTGSFTGSTVTTITIKAADLETASANMNGQNTLKVFVKDTSGLWSA